MRTRWQAKPKEVKATLQRRMHASVAELGQYLRSVVGGHVRYYGVPLNSRLIARWLPPAHVCHPYPLVRLGVITQGGSRMR
jgi:RNA-directed DNA polymerase